MQQNVQIPSGYFWEQETAPWLNVDENDGYVLYIFVVSPLTFPHWLAWKFSAAAQLTTRKFYKVEGRFILVCLSLCFQSFMAAVGLEGSNPLLFAPAAVPVLCGCGPREPPPADSPLLWPGDVQQCKEAGEGDFPAFVDRDVVLLRAAPSPLI